MHVKRAYSHTGTITWPEFKRRHATELKAHGGELRHLAAIAKRQDLTLVYAAHNQEQNHALLLQQRLKRLEAGRSGCVTMVLGNRRYS